MGSLGRIFYRIWFVGAAVWFFDALLSMHRHALGWGIAQAVLAGLFLLFALIFRREYKRRMERNRR